MGAALVICEQGLDGMAGVKILAITFTVITDMSTEHEEQVGAGLEPVEHPLSLFAKFCVSAPVGARYFIKANDIMANDDGHSVGILVEDIAGPVVEAILLFIEGIEFHMDDDEAATGGGEKVVMAVVVITVVSTIIRPAGEVGYAEIFVVIDGLAGDCKLAGGLVMVAYGDLIRDAVGVTRIWFFKGRDG